MKIETRYLAGGVLLVLALCVVACSSGPKAQAPPPNRPPRPTPDVEEVVVEEEIDEPVTETISTEVVISELPEDLAILNARGYLEDVFFDTDRFDLSPEARGILAKNANWMLQYPTVLILVEGHCDERNTREYNLALGERRANAVRDYLVSLGVAATSDPDDLLWRRTPVCPGPDRGGVAPQPARPLRDHGPMTSRRPRCAFVSLTVLAVVIMPLAACSSSSEDMALLHREITDVQRDVQELQTDSSGQEGPPGHGVQHAGAELAVHALQRRSGRRGQTAAGADRGPARESRADHPAAPDHLAGARRRRAPGSRPGRSCPR